jgi:hypothetical protein
MVLRTMRAERRGLASWQYVHTILRRGRGRLRRREEERAGTIGRGWSAGRVADWRVIGGVRILLHWKKGTWVEFDFG